MGHGVRPSKDEDDQEDLLEHLGPLLRGEGDPHIHVQDLPDIVLLVMLLAIIVMLTLNTVLMKSLEMLICCLPQTASNSGSSDLDV